MSTPLISAERLEERLATDHLFDVRWKLGEPGYGAAAYAEGHIPGAVFVDLDRDLSGPPSGARHPLPEIATFAATLGRLGLRPEDQVVVYDDGVGMVAARMWWMLWSIGHRTVRLLDGGLEAWSEAGFAIEAEPNIPGPAQYPVPGSFRGVVGPDDLEGRLVVDVRSSERYSGEIEPVDPRAGHIPGAISIPATENVESGRFADRDRLAGLYWDVSNPVFSCGSGVTACHSALAWVLTGQPMPDIYVGSFSEWSSSTRPINVGSKP